MEIKMKLCELLKNTTVFSELLPREGEVEIKSVCYDSRQAKADSLFVALVGSLSDGHNYAISAYERGCRAFICQREVNLPSDAVIILTPDTRAALADISQIFFGEPSKRLRVIGITGTKGKTTVAQLTYQILNSLDMKAGYIGTNGIFYDGKSFETKNTTPESYDLAYHMSEMLKCGVRYLALEVSSQALYLNRVHGMKFEVALFTNLSPDHIGEREHPSFEHYRDSKAKLFSDYFSAAAIYNADDTASEYMMKNYSGAKIGYSTVRDADISAEGIELFRDSGQLGVAFNAKIGKKKLACRLPLPGRFNVGNALAAMAACISCGADPSRVADALSNVSIAGRAEVVDALPYATFVIDYAHNGISLRSILEVLREYNPRRLICVFGSVGGRTQMRRSELGKVASSLCDFCILTADNPDTEPVGDINAEIAKEFDSEEKYISIESRREAVLYAVKMAQVGDIVLFAGKGHENYQIVDGKKEYFCEKETIIEGAFGMLLRG